MKAKNPEYRYIYIFKTLIIQQQNDSVQKCTKDLNRHFSKDEIQMTNNTTHEKNAQHH